MLQYSNTLVYILSLCISKKVTYSVAPLFSKYAKNRRIKTNEKIQLTYLYIFRHLKKFRHVYGSVLFFSGAGAKGSIKLMRLRNRASRAPNPHTVHCTVYSMDHRFNTSAQLIPHKQPPFMLHKYCTLCPPCIPSPHNPFTTHPQTTGIPHPQSRVYFFLRLHLYLLLSLHTSSSGHMHTSSSASMQTSPSTSMHTSFAVSLHTSSSDYLHTSS
jgi:hypothetical protein